MECGDTSNLLSACSAVVGMILVHSATYPVLKEVFPLLTRQWILLMPRQFSIGFGRSKNSGMCSITNTVQYLWAFSGRDTM